MYIWCIMLPCRAAFLPVDPSWPAARLEHILQQCQPAILVWPKSEPSHQAGNTGYASLPPQNSSQAEHYVQEGMEEQAGQHNAAGISFHSEASLPCAFPSCTQPVYMPQVRSTQQLERRRQSLQQPHDHIAKPTTSAASTTSPLTGAGAAATLAQSVAEDRRATVHEAAAAAADELQKHAIHWKQQTQHQAPLPYCYVMMTSGSSSEPVGVCGTEEGGT